MAPILFENDRKLMAHAWASLDPPPKIDYKKLATAAGYKDATAAKKAFLTARKRFLAVVETEDAGGEGEGDGTPKKRAKSAGPEEGSAKKKGRKTKAQKEAEAGEDGDGAVKGRMMMMPEYRTREV